MSERFDLRILLADVVGRFEKAGFIYPIDYIDHLYAKYEGKIKHPRIIQRLGEPRIRIHSSYQIILHSGGALLDYGCGTGDDIRALLSDGFTGNVVGFDINKYGIELGYDLYLDKQKMEQYFTTSDSLNVEPRSFDVIYSGSILHVFHSFEDATNYCQQAYDALKIDGIFFGSTIGKEHDNQIGPNLPLYIRELRRMLNLAQFKNITIEKTFSEGEMSRLWFYCNK